MTDMAYQTDAQRQLLDAVREIMARSNIRFHVIPSAARGVGTKEMPVGESVAPATEKQRKAVPRKATSRKRTARKAE